MKLRDPQPLPRLTDWASDRYGSMLNVPVFWKTPPLPQGISNVRPTAPRVPVSVLRRKVHFGPSLISAKPVSLLNPPTEWLGLIDRKPSSLITRESRSVNDTLAWVP